MGRRAQLEPRWLVSLLNLWASRSSVGRGLGYPSICPMLKSGIPQPARSYEPTGFCDQDVFDVEECVNELDELRKLAVMRYFKPWTKKWIDELWPRDGDTWMYHLKRALDEICEKMAKKRSQGLAA